MDLTIRSTVEIDGERLKAGSLALIDVMRKTAELRALSDHELVIVHAYVLGMLMAANNMSITSISRENGLGDLIADGIRDCERALEYPEGHKP